MNITLSVFDVFTYAIPGALYLAVLVYVFSRLHWIDLSLLTHGNGLLAFLGVALASYVTGHATYSLGWFVGNHIRIWPIRFSDARREFAGRTPEAGGRPFLRADKSLLQAAIESNSPESAVEMMRLRAVGLMVRNSATPIALGSIVATLEAITGTRPAAAWAVAAILLLAAVGLFWHGARFLHWGDLKILDLAFWIPGIDEALRDQAQNSGNSVPQPRKPRTTTGKHRTRALLVGPFFLQTVMAAI